MGSLLASVQGSSPSAVGGEVDRQVGIVVREESEKEEAAAVELVLSWLSVHGWEGVQVHLLLCVLLLRLGYIDTNVSICVCMIRM
jgi:hypothetical protein